jgi:polar amino acid transport system permease protein
LRYDWSFNFLWRYLPALLRAAALTLELAGIAIVGGTLLGIALASLRNARWKALRWPAAAGIEVGLALPLMVLLVWIYYCVPQFSARLTLHGFETAAIALTLNLAPFASETIRSGFATLPDDYALAARAVGLTPWQTFRHITFPLTLQRILPALVAHYVTTLKLVSICGIISVPEIVHVSSSIISREFRPLEVYTAMAVIYLVIVTPFTLLTRILERRYRVKN